MKQTKTKFFVFSSLVLSIIIFIFFSLSYFATIKIDLILTKVLIWAVLSIGLSFLITYGYLLTSTTIADAMTTLRRMLRADNLSHPLIMRLSSEAPGTYHHSINVSNLAQRAAKSIKTNSLLVRVASYYHDIGKLYDPKLYVENQTEKELLREENSAVWIRSNVKKIISHVDKGIKLAKEVGLPEEIIDIVAEHHGDSKALYFYGKAKEKGLKIKKSDFSYIGPKPQSKESAIVMLADCVEASARAQQPLSAMSITHIVSNIVEEKIKENQLSLCGLSQRELQLIRNSLIHTLNTIYHQRINYSVKNES